MRVPVCCDVQFTVTVTKSFIDYLETSPVVFEMFAHYTQHPLHCHAVNHSPLHRYTHTRRHLRGRVKWESSPRQNPSPVNTALLTFGFP